jgi:hypothetical protein
MPFALFGSNPSPSLVQLDSNFSAVAFCADNFTGVRALPKTGSTPYAQALGSTTRGDGGGGVYYLDAADTTSAESLPGIIVATDGGRWKLATSLTNVTTQSIANNGTAAASTAFVRLLGLARASLPTALTAAATLTATAAGTQQLWSGTSAATITLPAASAVPAGQAIEFLGSGATMAVATISRAGTDTILDGEVSITSVQITQPGTSFQLVSNGSNGWRYVGPRRRYESAWTATLPASSTATTFTHGLGTTPRRAYVLAECTTADGSFAVGDRIEPFVNPVVGSGWTQPVQMVMTSTSAVLATSNGGSWFSVPKTGGAAVGLTPASWKYRVVVDV